MIEGIGGKSLQLRMPQEFPDAAGAARPGALGSPGPAGEAGGGFGSTIKEFLGEVNDLSLKSEDVFRSFVRGDVTDLHQVVLAQQEAGIAVRLVTEMRDKLLQAYQEIMRTTM